MNENDSEGSICQISDQSDYLLQNDAMYVVMRMLLSCDDQIIIVCDTFE